MFHILKSDKSGANWVIDFVDNLKAGFKHHNVPLVEVDYGSILELKESDYVIIPNYKDLSEDSVRFTPAKLVVHSNGTSANPYAYNVFRDAEEEQLGNLIEVNTLNLPTQEKIMREVFPFMKETIVIGFPLNFDKYNPYKSETKKKKIVIGGRISPDKQFYLAAFLLKDLLKEYEIVFTVIDKNAEWREFYDAERFRRMGYRIVDCPTSDRFYRELSDAEIFFTASLGDTCSVGIAEASLLGCYIVAPDILDGFPMWRDYVSNGYEPFSKRDVERMVREKPKQEVDLSWFDHKEVCRKLIAGLSR